MSLKSTFSLKYLLISIWAMFTLGCGTSTTLPEEDDATKTTAAGITATDWGIADGKPVKLFTLSNGNGTVIKITNYGGIITSWITPDKNNEPGNVVVGFDSLAPYLLAPPYFGALIGRYGNRIAGGTFTLDGNTYKLATNNGPNHLHGGVKGFDKVVWDAATDPEGGVSLTLSYTSKDGEEGYPGNLKVQVVYSLSMEGELIMDYSAETDKPTIVNLTNHAYFNLSGNVANGILGHFLQVKADKYTPVDSTLIPTGELAAVAGTPFDFTTPTTIGERIQQVEGGYDHNFVLSRSSPEMEWIATLYDTLSGRQLQIATTEPGLQFYSGNFLDGTLINADGKPLQKHAALCLETQHFPNSPNQTNFPSTVLRPGEKYNTTTIYKITGKQP